MCDCMERHSLAVCHKRGDGVHGLSLQAPNFDTDCLIVQTGIWGYGNTNSGGAHSSHNSLGKSRTKQIKNKARVGIEFSDRTKSSDTINSHIKQLSDNAWNSHK